MRKFYLLFILLLLFFNSFAQKISGIVLDEENKFLIGAVIYIENIGKGAMTDEKGEFTFDKIKQGNYSVKVSYVGYEMQKREITVTEKDVDLKFILKSADIVSEEIIVSANRAGFNTPIAYTNVGKSDLEKNNTGRDIPYLLSLTPSVVVSSDAGSGVGYTSIRVRGSDMTRINVMLDGIPLNDSESHGVWWVNMPDFASSVDNVQIQRGVGTSTNGAGAFGANINFKTNTLKKKAYCELDGSIGSFETKKTTFKAGTGIFNKYFVVDTRFSKITSAGFIDKASSDLQSFFISGAFVSKKNLLKVNIIKGEEETYQAWNGVPKDSLETNRTYNPYTYDNQIDNYGQLHYQMFYTHEFNKNFNINVALHRTEGKGYYEQFKDGESFDEYGLENINIGEEIIDETDLIRRKYLDNNLNGVVYSLNYKGVKFDAALGGAWNKYDGDHFGRVIWAKYSSNGNIRHEWYRNNGSKTDINDYFIINYKPNKKINIRVDLQYRIIKYSLSGIHDDLNDISQDHSYNFFNPKAGLYYKFSENQNAYFSFATANREPSRGDFRDAEQDKTPEYETLYDYELGYKFVAHNLAFNVNAYYMDYKNQLALTGEINGTGSAIMVNVPKSYRMGVEFEGGIKLFEIMDWNFNATFSKNKISDFTEYVDDWDNYGSQISNELGEVDISFSPDIIAGSDLNFTLFKNLSLGFISKYVGRQFIDNTSNLERSLDAYFVNNLRLRYSFSLKPIKEIILNFHVNNIFNAEYETNAWVYRYYYGNEHYVMDGYFPQAGINFTGGISLRF